MTSSLINGIHLPQSSKKEEKVYFEMTKEQKMSEAVIATTFPITLF